MDVNKKYLQLQEILSQMGSVVIAFSGGVDSTFLLKTAVDVLGKNAVGVVATSSTYPDRELDEAKKLAGFIGAEIKIIKTEELEVPGFKSNPPDRCYFCKKDLFKKIKDIAKELNYNFVAEGSNVDDLSDFRPGLRAIKELGVRSPLKEAGFTKQEIRKISKKIGLPTWNKPSYACLASRFPYGMEIDETKLKMVEKAENFLIEAGFKVIRVRHHYNTARIEVGKNEIKKILNPQIRENIVKFFKNLGYLYITVDLEGYRTGSMNLGIKKD